jgi:hypothetical protein
MAHFQTTPETKLALLSLFLTQEQWGWEYISVGPAEIWRLASFDDCESMNATRDVKVIGNIYENPELLTELHGAAAT